MILTFVGQYFVPELIAINGFIVILSPFIYLFILLTLFIDFLISKLAIMLKHQLLYVHILIWISSIIFHSCASFG